MQTRVALLTLPLVALACGGPPELVPVTAPSSNGGVPVDARDRGTERSFTPGPPHAGSWAPTRTYQAPHFTIQYPASARAFMSTDERFAQPLLWIVDLPECTVACDLMVSVWKERGHPGLDSVVRLAIAPHPKTKAALRARIVDTTAIGGRRAIRIRIDCPSCYEDAYFIEEHGWYAQVSIGLSACDSLVMPKLIAIAQSFRFQGTLPEPKPGW